MVGDAGAEPKSRNVAESFRELIRAAVGVDGGSKDVFASGGCCWVADDEDWEDCELGCRVLPITLPCTGGRGK